MKTNKRNIGLAFATAVTAVSATIILDNFIDIIKDDHHTKEITLIGCSRDYYEISFKYGYRVDSAWPLSARQEATIDEEVNAFEGTMTTPYRAAVADLTRAQIQKAVDNFEKTNRDQTSLDTFTHTLAEERDRSAQIIENRLGLLYRGHLTILPSDVRGSYTRTKSQCLEMAP